MLNASDVGALPSTTEIPENTSDLTNDSGFITSSAVPTKTSDLTNDSNFVSDASYVHTDNNYTSNEKSKLSGIASGAEVNVQADWNVTSTSSDAYIKNKPTIPTATSQLTNDSGYITASDIPTATSSTLGMVKPDNTSITISNGTISAVGGVPVGLADVAYSGEYNDLLNKPDIMENDAPLFKTTIQQITVSSTAHGSNFSNSFAIANSPSGYVCLGVIQWDWVSGTRQNWFSNYGIWANKTTIYVKLCNMHASDNANGVLEVCLLWARSENTSHYSD